MTCLVCEGGATESPRAELKRLLNKNIYPARTIVCRPRFEHLARNSARVAAHLISSLLRLTMAESCKWPCPLDGTIGPTMAARKFLAQLSGRAKL